MTAQVSIRGPALLGLGALAVLILGFGLWSVTATLSGAVVTRGRIELDQSHMPIQHQDGGTVVEVRAVEGKRVAEGDVLIVLDGTALRAESALLDLRLDELRVRSARLQAERDGRDTPDLPPEVTARAAENPELRAQIDGQLTLFAARRTTFDEIQAQLAQRIIQVRAQIRGLRAQQAALEAQLRLVADDLAAQEALFDRGLVPQAGVLALRRELARLSGQAGELQATLAAAEGQITEIGLQGSALAARRQEEAAAELREIEPMIAEQLARRAVLADRIAALELRAPVPGTVMGLVVAAPGTVLRGAETALVIVPSDRPLVIGAGVAAIDIDEVTPGQKAALGFPALIGRDLPQLTGHVTQISPDAVTDPATGAAHFLVRIEIAPGELARLGDRALVPGMPVDVFLATRARTPLAYLVEPFSTYFTRALREG